MDPMTARAISFVLWLVLFVSACSADSGLAQYGTKVRFRQDVPVRFPDFALTYLGARRVASNKFPSGFVFHDFRIATAAGPRSISWSSGTGDLSPTFCSAGAKSFTLELRSADGLGALRDDEVVLRRAP